jgi:uncharacterized membrane protein YecN with MAPEG domain
METATLIVMLALLEYFWFTGRVGAYRGKYKVDAPKCTGDDIFEKALRVQQNTLEQLIIFIPGTFAFAHFVSVKWVWIPGGLFIVGRYLYSGEYLTKPDSRAPGMSMTLLSNAILVLGTLGVLVMGLF